MVRKKKKKGQPQARRGPGEEARDEMLALEAIYGEQLFAADTDGQGFTLRVLPHPGEAEANLCSVQLAIRYPGAYPSVPLVLRVGEPVGLPAGEVRKLYKQLTAQAAVHAQEEEVCAFELVTLCQDFLRERNKAVPGDDESQAPKSLWHEMLLRDTGAAGEAGLEVSLPGMLDGGGWGGTGFDGGLFDAADEAQAAWPPALAAQPDPTAASKPLSRLSVAAAALDEGMPTGGRISPSLTAAQSSRTHVAGGSPTESTSGVVTSMLSAVRSGITAVGRAMGVALPPALRRMLDSSSEGAGRAEDQEAGGSEGDREAVRRDLLLGHLLALATAGAPGGLPQHALAPLAASLTARGLLPKWVQWAVTQQPQLFDRAFQRFFAEELQEDSQGLADPSAAWALHQFWQRKPAPRLTALTPTVQAEAADKQPVQGVSRYVADFQELRVLGRGGFGTVVCATNRLDGRQYAIKKIRIDGQSPGAYARLMREVATLSRLQHPHVVRYFQAWCELAPESHSEDVETDLGEDSELADWLAESSSSAPLVSGAPAPLGFRLNSIQPAGLETVEEESREGGSPSSPHDGTASAPADSVEQASQSGPGLWQRRASSASATTGSWSETQNGSQPGAPQREAAPPQQAKDQHAEPAGAQRQWLYIQMEFCPRTLREVLDAGQLDEEGAWQVVRQTLAGLAHIHAQGIIHRDLKPANIFYDARADVKLGDFGLAKFQRADTDVAAAEEALPLGSQPGPAGQQSTTEGGMPSESSGVLGTSFYISPEIAQGWARYDERVDLYSLGVMAFELWHPFSTAMERVALLRDLVDRQRLPPGFETAHPQVARLIRWLMAPNPRERPTAAAVLRSELLPPTVGDEQLTDLLRSLPDSPDTCDRVVEALFALPAAPPASAGGLPAEVAGSPVAMDVEARSAVLDVVRSTFMLHGACASASTDIGYATAEAPPYAARLIAQSGAQLALRYELRYPFAAWLAQQAATAARGSPGLEAMRRYEVAWVRRRAPGLALPRAYQQADFDIVTPGGGGLSERMLAEAEVVKALTEVVEALPECGAYEVRVSHAALRAACLRHLGLPPSALAPAAALLASAGTASPVHPSARSKLWPSIRVGLEGLGADASAVARTRALLLAVPGEAAGGLHAVRARLEAGSAALPQAAAHALKELQAVVSHLAVWGVRPASVLLDPLLPPHADYFSGITFQVHLVQADSGASALVAVGGRYDGLIKALWPPGAAGPPVSAVGATLNLERLMLAAAPSASRTPAGMLATSQAEVLVCGKGGGGLLAERMALVAELWADGLRAELLALAAPSMKEQYEYAHARHIPWLVIIDAATFSTTDTVKVKHLERRTEAENSVVAKAEVARFLASALSAAHSGPLRPGPARTPSRLDSMRTTADDDDSGGREDAPEPSGRRGRRR